jgi:thiol-disulfide isomerase/thioredoxin
MALRSVASALFILLLLSVALAQTVPAPPAQAQGAAAQPPKPAGEAQQPAARETPPDQKAYTEAGRITDPEKKIQAYEKFKKDFPTSTMAQSADLAILGTLIQKFPKQSDRIRKFAAATYGKAEPKNRGALGGQIASQLLSGGVLLKDAEKYAQKSLDAMLLGTYLQEQIAGYEKRKQKPPPPEELQKRFNQSRAVRLATLGRVEVKLGHNDKAQKLLDEAYAVDKTSVTVQAALGELAAKAGKDDKALEYLIPARLAGSGGKDVTATLEAVYRKQHNNSLDGMEAMLDGEYRKRFPNPVKVEHYKPGEKRSDRVVLGEVFTGSGCPPCAAADVAFDAAMERYSRKELAVVMYHQHIPRPDPMTNPDTQARNKSYGVTGVPTFAVDGKKTVGGGSRDMAPKSYAGISPDIEKELEKPAEAHFSAGANLSGNRVSVRVLINGVESEAKDLKLHIVLVEKELRFNGENGVRFHPMVVRAMGGPKAEGFDLDSAAGKTFDQTFDIDEISKAIKTHLDAYEAGGHRGEAFTFAEKKYQINRSNLAVVVFVQEDKTKHVLQAGYIDLGERGLPATEASSSGNE